MSNHGVIVWFTGLSGAGKSTLSEAVATRIRAVGRKVERLDGDVVRTHLSKGLGFSREDRDTNVRRIGFVAHLLQRNGVFAVTAAISPYRETRAWCRSLAPDAFVEVFVNAPIETCMARDVKGLYKRAVAGTLPNFTGVSDPYEPPEHPEVEIRTDRVSIDAGVDAVIAELRRRGHLANDTSLTPTLDAPA